MTSLLPSSCAGISIMSLKAKYPLTHGGPMARRASASAKAQDLRFYCGGSDRLPHIGIYVEVYGCLIIDQSRTIRAALGNKKGSLASAMCGVVVLLS